MLNHIFDTIKDRLQEIKVKYPLETEENNLIYGEIFYDIRKIWCGDYSKDLSIQSGGDFARDLLYCRDDFSYNGCAYRLDSKNRLISEDKTRIRMSNKRAIKFLCRVCGYIPKNRYQILVPKPLQ